MEGEFVLSGKAGVWGDAMLGMEVDTSTTCFRYDFVVLIFCGLRIGEEAFSVLWIFIECRACLSCWSWNWNLINIDGGKWILVVVNEYNTVTICYLLLQLIILRMLK